MITHSWRKKTKSFKPISTDTVRTKQNKHKKLLQPYLCSVMHSSEVSWKSNMTEKLILSNWPKQLFRWSSVWNGRDENSNKMACTSWLLNEIIIVTKILLSKLLKQGRTVATKIYLKAIWSKKIPCALEQLSPCTTIIEPYLKAIWNSSPSKWHFISSTMQISFETFSPTDCPTHIHISSLFFQTPETS